MTQPHGLEDDDLATFLFGPSGTSQDAFDEPSYLAANPHVVDAISSGEVASALDHYLRFGKSNGRPRLASQPLAEVHISTSNTFNGRHAIAASPSSQPVTAPPHNLDAVVVSDTSVFVAAWASDFADPLAAISVSFEDASITIKGDQCVRCRRQDVEQALGMAGAFSFGLCAFSTTSVPIRHWATCQVDLRFRSGASQRHSVTPRKVDNRAQRDLVLDYFNSLNFFGNKQVESFYALDASVGDQLIRLNKDISSSVVKTASAHVYGRLKKAYKGSIIVCLYGKPEFLFLQNALFSPHKSASDYEYIYVVNSPDILERLDKEATISHRVYGLSQTIVALSGNAGFGAANNVAAGFARSDRVMIVNPDVFPYNADWASAHTSILSSAPQKSTKIFGVPLYYADGSLMHAGMYIDVDLGTSVEDTRVRRRPMLRVEHYGKGAPPQQAEYLNSRPVPAVTGAFISVERSHFERLGGFSEEYIFGHYEDADLCLKSIGTGFVPWIHDVPFWHLEGKGGTRKSHHEGASTVNRWYFTKTWHDTVAHKLLGRSPNLKKYAPAVET